MAQQLVRPPITNRPPRMTFEEFLAWADEDTRAEWVDGEVIEFMPTGQRHIRLVRFLITLISAYVDLRYLGEVLVEPFQFWTKPGQALRRPDVSVLLTASQHRFTPAAMVGAPDLVVEVVSEDSKERDRDDKRAEYAAADVPEYWIVEGREGRDGVTFLALRGDGAYEEVRPDGQGRLHSRVLTGFWLDPTWLAEETLPNLYTVLAAIATDASAAFGALARQASPPNGSAASSNDSEPS